MLFTPEACDRVTKLTCLLGGTFCLEAVEEGLGVGEEAREARTKAVIRRVRKESIFTDEPFSDSDEKKQEQFSDKKHKESGSPVPSNQTIWKFQQVLLDDAAMHVRVDPAIFHHVTKLGHVFPDDQTRAHMADFIGRALARAESDLYLEDQDTVYGHVSGEWPYMQEVLRQAIHCTDNTYPVYLKVAVEMGDILIRLYPEEATNFFRLMAAAAEIFGTPRDQATLQALTGSAITQGAAMTEWREAMDCFERALPVLREKKTTTPDLTVAQLLCYAGSACFRQNKLEESERYFREALECCDVENPDDEKATFVLINVRAMQILPAIFRGRLKEAKNVLEKTLDLCRDTRYEKHPFKAVLLNSFGLIFERGGESQETALRYYLRSLEERRRYRKMQSLNSLIAPLNNIGMQYCKRSNYKTGLRYLEEAAQLMGETKHYYTALTQHHLAQVYLQKGDFKLAEQHLAEAERMYFIVTPKHDVRAKVALIRAHVYVTDPCFDVSKVEEFLRQAVDISQASGNDMGDAALLVALSTVEHLLQIDGWRTENLKDMLDWILERLECYKGDKSEQITDHEKVLTEVAVRGNRASEKEREDWSARAIKRCQQCAALNENDDAVVLWENVQRETENP